jgi:hypothetical protein
MLHNTLVAPVIEKVLSGTQDFDTRVTSILVETAGAGAAGAVPPWRVMPASPARPPKAGPNGVKRDLARSGNARVGAA